MASEQSGRFSKVALVVGAIAALLLWLSLRSGGGQRDVSLDAAEGLEPQAQGAAPPPAPTPRPPVPKAAPAPAPPVAAAEQPAEPEAEVVDLFAGDMPDFMVPLHMRVLDKRKLGASQQKQLYDYGQEHPDDARPQLLLAWDSMNRDWDGIAVRMYRMAFRADARAKDDPTMLRDLLAVAETHDRVEFRETAALVEEAYGTSVLPRIEARLAELQAAGKTEGVRRLTKLREQLLGDSP